jgi:cytochrome c-type biogenesis protein CcmH/NrfG
LQLCVSNQQLFSYMFKHKHHHLALAFLLLIASFTTQALTPSQVFDKVKDTVVVIKSLNAKGEGLGQGSGVILPTGKVATNCHVVKGGARFQAGRDNRFVPATLFAADADKDICLLQADTLTGTPAQLGKAGALKVGEAVYAVGAPQGLELSLSNGLVSQLRGGTPPLIQTTAPISQGSSGGGLFDSEARLVGFTTFYVKEGQSLNFAMPVEWLADVKPGNPIASSKRSHVDWFTQSIALQKAQNWPKLRDWALLWAQTAPQSAEAWSTLGFAYASLKSYSKAIDAYRQAIRINPQDADAWYNLGTAHGYLKRYNEAIDAYRQAIRINPEYASAWHNLGNAYVGLKRYNEAIDAYRQAIRINPEAAAAWYNLGVTYRDLQRYNEAIDAFRQAIRINPEYAAAWSNLAGAYYVTGNKTAALQAINSLRPLDPAQADSLFDLIMPK